MFESLLTPNSWFKAFLSRKPSHWGEACVASDVFFVWGRRCSTWLEDDPARWLKGNTHRRRNAVLTRVNTNWMRRTAVRQGTFPEGKIPALQP